MSNIEYANTYPDVTPRANMLESKRSYWAIFFPIRSSLLHTCAIGCDNPRDDSLSLPTSLLQTILEFALQVLATTSNLPKLPFLAFQILQQPTVP